MADLGLIGGAYAGRSRTVNVQECINLMLEVDPIDETKRYLIGTPGALLWETSTTMEAVRAMLVVDGQLYAVIGSKLKRFDALGNEADLGTLTTGTERLTMEDNGTTGEIFIACGATGYVYNIGSATLTQLLTGSPATVDEFDGAATVTEMDGYFLFNVPNSRKFRATALNDALTIDGLSFANKEGASDNLLRVLADHRELWLFGAATTEVWYNSGNADFPFERFQGGFSERGIAAAHSVAKIDNSLVWVEQSKRGNAQFVRAGEGYRPTVISPPSINEQLSRYSTVADAFAYSYQFEGHEFYVCTFPTADVTWVWDALTQEWHKRSFNRDDDGARHRHIGNCYAFFDGKHLIGDYRATGKIFQLDPDTVYDDATHQIIAERIGSHIREGDYSSRLPEVRVVLEEGVGLTTGQGSEPVVELCWSKDGGHTWGNWVAKSMGATGEYGMRAIWRKLGFSRKGWVFWLRISDPVKRIVLEATGDLLLGWDTPQGRA